MSTKTARRALLPVLLLLGLLIVPAARAGGDSGISWGYDFFGQLGHPAPEICGGAATPCAKYPKPITEFTGISRISATQNDTYAVLGDGSVRAEGVNYYGQLGNGTSLGTPGPVTPEGLGSNVVQVATGYTHALALLENGTVMAWGTNKHGELGQGSTSGPETCELSPDCSTKPIAVPGVEGAIAVAAGSEFSAALLANGTVIIWGRDSRGQLGDGTGISSGCECTDHPVPVPGVTGVVAISAGISSAMALLADGSVRSWGSNTVGTLGNGTAETGGTCHCLGPVAASGVSGARAISSGGSHEIATISDGSILDWGENEHGQLGNGTFNGTGCLCVPTPAAVPGLTGLQSVAAGTTHTLALLGNGSVDAWGENEMGALGEGSETDRPSPTPVPGLGGATAVSAGEINSYVLVGTSQALNVELAGVGSGTVGGPSGIRCGPSCSARYPQSQTEILREEPAAGSAFAGWSGACTGTAVTCRVKLDGDQAVAATYGPPKGTKVTKVALNRKKRSATITFSAPGAITGYKCQLVPPKPKKKKHGGKHGSARSAAAAKFKAYAACGSPKAYKHLKPGAYTFRVRALDSLGVDEHPAVKHFVVKAPKPKRHHKK